MDAGFLKFGVILSFPTPGSLSVYRVRQLYFQNLARKWNFALDNSIAFKDQRIIYLLTNTAVKHIPSKPELKFLNALSSPHTLDILYFHLHLYNRDIFMSYTSEACSSTTTQCLPWAPPAFVPTQPHFPMHHPPRFRRSYKEFYGSRLLHPIAMICSSAISPLETLQSARVKSARLPMLVRFRSMKM